MRPEGRTHDSPLGAEEVDVAEVAARQALLGGERTGLRQVVGVAVVAEVVVL